MSHTVCDIGPVRNVAALGIGNRIQLALLSHDAE